MRRVIYVRRNVPHDGGLGVDLTSMTGGVTDAVAAAIVPKLEDIVVTKIVPAILLGLALGAAISAAIGAHFATRRSVQVRRNPPRRRWAA